MDILDLSYILCVAFVTAAINGFVGVGGGFLPAIFLAPIIGVKELLPALSVMLLISNFSRSWINREDFHKDAFLRVVIPAVPMVFLGGYFYSMLEPQMIALFLGVVILASIPLRRWAKSRSVKTSPITLSLIGGVFGFLCGSSVGPGMLLIPFMLGYGLTPVNFVATLAVIASLTNIARVVTFSSLGLIDQHLLMIGIMAGLATIPGNILGRKILKRLKVTSHGYLVDILTLGGGLNFIWMALK